MLNDALMEGLPKLLQLITKETLRKYGTDQSNGTLVVRNTEADSKMLVQFISEFLDKLKDFRQRRIEGARRKNL